VAGDGGRKTETTAVETVEVHLMPRRPHRCSFPSVWMIDGTRTYNQAAQNGLIGASRASVVVAADSDI
jgi:hypothetical protein